MVTRKVQKGSLGSCASCIDLFVDRQAIVLKQRRILLLGGRSTESYVLRTDYVSTG